MIRNLFSKHIIEDNKLKIALSWDILNGATNYDIYIKDNINGEAGFELYKYITQEEFLKNSNVIISIDLNEDINEIAYEIYVVGRNEEGTSKPSNIESIKDNIIKDNDDEENDNDNENIDDNEDKEEEVVPDET